MIPVFLSTHVFASDTDYSKLDTPEEWTSIDADKLQQNELLEAFNALRYKYILVYDSEQEQSSTTEPETELNKASDWSKHYYVDEFELPTDDAYISTLFEGKFSNSATTNATLSGKILVDEDSASIFLYEYGYSTVKNGYSKGYDNRVLILDDSGEKHQIYFFFSSGSDRMSVFPSKEYGYGSYKKMSDPNYENFIELLKTNKSLSFSITDSKHVASKYIFTISTDGFLEQYESLLR